MFLSWEDIGPFRLTYLEFCVCVNTKLMKLFILLERFITYGLTAGTWVNSHKVGKNNTYPLEQYDTISFCTPLKKVFVFFSNERPRKSSRRS